MKGVMSITGSPSPERSCSCCPVEHRHTCTCIDGGRWGEEWKAGGEGGGVRREGRGERGEGRERREGLGGKSGRE